MIQLEGELFEAVQNPGIFKDSKTFVDAIPKIDESEILQEFRKRKNAANFRLESFLREYFIFPHNVTSPAAKVDTTSMETYINSLWNTLERQPAAEKENDTLIPLKYPYIVPGGRFREIYYWDSYFTSLGLATIDRFDIIESMIKNFIYLQSILGLIPNGNRKYYISRTQPPVLSFMVDLLYQKYGLDYIKPYIESLEKEYKFWMDNRIIQMPDGSILNRYCDSLCTPRPEAYIEDVTLAQKMSDEDAKRLLQNIRSAAESGWDFSARWFKDPMDLGTIQTTLIIPVDLNSLLYGIEKLLGKYCDELGDVNKSALYLEHANKRKEAINKYFWDEDQGFYFDYNIQLQSRTEIYSAAGVVPMFVSIASQQQAALMEKQITEKLLKPGGLVSTTIETGQQWDSPNGWAPLQWFAVKGLLNYNKTELADEIMQRWLTTLRTHFAQTKMLMEKYNVCEPNILAKGGEYSVQEGFGWTNGVALKFLELTR